MSYIISDYITHITTLKSHMYKKVLLNNKTSKNNPITISISNSKINTSVTEFSFYIYKLFFYETSVNNDYSAPPERYEFIKEYEFILTYGQTVTIEIPDISEPEGLIRTGFMMGKNMPSRCSAPGNVFSISGTTSWLCYNGPSLIINDNVILEYYYDDDHYICCSGGSND